MCGWSCAGVRTKIFQGSEFVKTFAKLDYENLMPEMQKIIGGHHDRFGDKLCVRQW